MSWQEFAFRVLTPPVLVAATLLGGMIGRRSKGDHADN